MPSLSFLPLLRLPLRPILPPSISPILRRRRGISFISAASRNSNPNRNPHPPSKHILRARDSSARVRDLSSLSASPLTSFEPKDLLPNQAIGLVAASQANFMRVIVEAPPPNPNPSTPLARIGKELLCVVRALLKKIKRRVLVGDRVLVGSVDWNSGRGMIEDVFERETEILDPPVANVDHLLVMFAMDQPRPEPFTLTRFLVEAESMEIPFTLVMNKAELVGDETLTEWRIRLHSWGYKPLFCSVDRKSGMAALEDIFKGQTTVIVGPSGVGKSSLINSLRSNQTIAEEETNDFFEHNGGSKWLGEQRVDTVSRRSGQGKHTTRNVSLLPLASGGYLCDTPGFNQPSLLKVTKRSLADTFPEIRRRLSASAPSKCSFNDCLHLGEPGCVVNTDWERYPYYFQLLDEIKIREVFQLRTWGTKRESDVRYKVGEMGVKQAEPRLEIKKHRRVSRRQLNQSILDDVDEDFEEARY